jgi:hypothetical protein
VLVGWVKMVWLIVLWPALRKIQAIHSLKNIRDCCQSISTQKTDSVRQTIISQNSSYLTGDDDVPGDVLKLLGEGGLKILTKLFNTIYETGESGRRTSRKVQRLH